MPRPPRRQHRQCFTAQSRLLDAGRRVTWSSHMLTLTMLLFRVPDDVLGDLMPRLLEIKAKTKVPIQYHFQVEVGDGKTAPPKEVAAEVTEVLAEIAGELQLR